MTGPNDKSALTLAAAHDLAMQALAHWQGILHKPQLVMHRENTVFRVKTESGDAALRIHRAGYHTRAAIRSELGWMAHLARSGIPVPAPIATAEGEWTVDLQTGQFAPRTADLLTWLDGQPLGQSGRPLARSLLEHENVFRELGRTMARFHSVCDKWSAPSDFSRHAWDLDGLVGVRPFWGPFWAISGLSRDEEKLLLAIRDKAAADLEALKNAGSDYGLIHADLVRENVLVDGHAISMIDFDDAGYGFRMFDVATALFKNRAEPDYADLEEALLDGYLAERPALKAELPSLPLFTVLRALTYLGWGEARKSEPGMEARRARFKAEALGLAQAYLR